MIVFMAGYPKSGKTELVKLLTSRIDPKIKTVLIDPFAICPPEYDQLSEEDKRAARLAAWDVSQEQLVDAIAKEPPSTLIIYDSCAAKITTMLQHFVSAKVHNHPIFYVFVGTKLDECKNRAGEKWPSKEVINRYAADFGESVPRLKAAATHFLFVKNPNDPDRIALKDAANKLIQSIVEKLANKPIIEFDRPTKPPAVPPPIKVINNPIIKRPINVQNRVQEPKSPRGPAGRTR